MFFRNLRPILWSVLRKAISGAVSHRGVACMARRTEGEEADGALDLMECILPRGVVFGVFWSFIVMIFFRPTCSTGNLKRFFSNTNVDIFVGHCCN